MILQSATTKLTLSYLTIIMIMSIGFSVILFRISSSELEHGLRASGPQTVEIFGIQGQSSFNQFRTVRLNESDQRLRNNLVLFNIVTLIIGGALSYLLARKSLEPIEEAMEAQSRFTADASHELRTPLTAMQTEIEVSLRNPKLDKQAAVELLKSNLEEVGKLKSLADGLLRLARQDSQQLVLAKLPLSKVAAEAIERVAIKAKQNNIKIDNNIKSMNVHADKEALTEILVILLDNAIKYSPPNKTVKLSAEQNGNTDMKVSDEGYGISATDQTHIFERFYRADMSRTKKHTEGYGLGLAIAQQLAKLHGGNIKVESELEKGSTFTLTLPSDEV